MSKISLDKKKTLYIIASIIFLFFIALTSMKMGSLDISYGEIIKGIFTNSTTGNFAIIKDLRFPRVIIAILPLNICISPHKGINLKIDGSKSFDIPADTLVSMNMFCFTKDIMNHIEEGFVPFMEANKNNLDSCEYLIPTVVSDLINDGVVSCEVLSTKSVWYGITYKDDKDYVVSSLENMMKNGEYPEGIWK